MSKQKVHNNLAGDYFVETEQQIDGSQRQVVKIAETSAASSPSGIVSGFKDITAAGTAEQITATATTCTQIWITAKPDNTKNLFIGDSGVDNTEGLLVFPAQRVEIPIDDISKLYFDIDTGGDGEGFYYVYFTA